MLCSFMHIGFVIRTSAIVLANIRKYVDALAKLCVTLLSMLRNSKYSGYQIQVPYTSTAKFGESTGKESFPSCAIVAS